MLIAVSGSLSPVLEHIVSCLNAAHAKASARGAAVKRLSGSPQGQQSVIPIRKSTRQLRGKARQQESRDGSRSISVAPAQLSSLPRSDGAEMQLLLGWRVAAGQHEDRAEGRRARRSSLTLLLGSASLFVQNESAVIFSSQAEQCSCINLGNPLV